MLKGNYNEAISIAVAGIGAISAPEDLDVSSVKLGVVLRLLNAAGWDAFDISEVVPDYPTSNGKVDFALVAVPSRGTGGPATPQVLVDVRPFSESLDGARHERRLVAQCSRVGAPLGVLTNGRRWLLLFQAPDYRGNGHRFCEVDLAGDPVAAAEELNRYLSRDRVASGQAARSAERTLRDRTRDTVTRQAVLDGWRQVVLGLQDGLVELIATAAEQRAGYRPEVRQVRRVLTESRAELLPLVDDQAGPAGAGGGSSRRRPASFTLLSETRPVSSWPDLLVQVCLLMRQRHPEDFEKVLEVRGRERPYFSRSEEDLYVPKPVGDTGIYASCQGAGSLIEQRARRGGGMVRPPCRFLDGPDSLICGSVLRFTQRETWQACKSFSVGALLRGPSTV